jgi:hypothetical protein
MGREWEDKSWEQVCCLPLSIPLNSFSVEPLFVRYSRCIFASILQLSIILSSRELDALYKFMWMIFLALRPEGSVDINFYSIQTRIAKRITQFLSWNII